MKQPHTTSSTPTRIAKCGNCARPGKDKCNCKPESGAADTSSSETGDSDISSSGHVGFLNPFERKATIQAYLSYQSSNRYGFFSTSTQKQSGFFNLQLKPVLSEEEKEMLREFLKVLCLSHDEFMLKLDELKLSLRGFVSNLKENLVLHGIPSPLHSQVFLHELTMRNLLPRTLLEKLEAQSKLGLAPAEDQRRFNPSPFSMRPTPLRLV